MSALLHPSFAIREAMTVRGWNYHDLLNAMRLPNRELRDVVLLALMMYGKGNPELELDYEMAGYLATAFNTARVHWLLLDHNYREAKEDPAGELARSWTPRGLIQ